MLDLGGHEIIMAILGVYGSGIAYGFNWLREVADKADVKNLQERIDKVYEHLTKDK